MANLYCVSVFCLALVGLITAATIPVGPVLNAHEANTNFPIVAEDLESAASQTALLNLVAGAEKDYDAEDVDVDASQELAQKQPVKFGFWTVHPNDLLPMRRLVRPNKRLNAFGIGKRAAYKKSESPYHPVPRSVVMGKHNDATSEEMEIESSENERTITKRQSPGSYLLLKLSRMNRVPPTNPSEGKSFFFNRAQGRDSKRS